MNKTGSGTTLSDFSVPATGGYDGVGNRLSVTASMPGAPASYSGTTTYAYDYGQSANPMLNRSQLTGETSTLNGGYTSRYSYDGGTSTGPGNPTSFNGAVSTFNADNQATNSGYTYDGNGSPTTYQGAAFGYDPQSRLNTFNLDDTFYYNYDGDGLQVSKQEGSNNGTGRVEYFLYDGAVCVAHYLYSGGTNLRDLNTVTFGADGLLSSHDYTYGASSFCTFDERGNVAQSLSSAGAVLGTFLYPVYGNNPFQADSFDEGFGFGGQWGYYSDGDVGLILCTHRYYDPQTGRWLTRDPLGYAGGVNLYGYVKNSPVVWNDRSGCNALGDTLDNIGTTLMNVGGALGSDPINWLLPAPVPIPLPCLGYTGVTLFFDGVGFSLFAGIADAL